MRLGNTADPGEAVCVFLLADRTFSSLESCILVLTHLTHHQFSRTHQQTVGPWLAAA